MSLNRQPSLESVLRDAGTTVLNVDKPTFDALQLAQDATRYVHDNTRYGAPNQVTHIYRTRDGSRTNAEVISRFNQSMAAFFELTGITPTESAESTFQMTTKNVGIMAGLTLLSAAPIAIHHGLG